MIDFIIYNMPPASSKPKTSVPELHEDTDSELDDHSENEKGDTDGSSDESDDKSDDELNVDGDGIERGDEDYDDSEYDISAKVGFDKEPTDIEMISELGQDLNGEEDDDFLVSKDTLNIHTSPYLTKYEMTKVLALRSQQILTGAPPTVSEKDFKDGKYPIDSYTIAMMELKKSRLPLIIGRRLPNNTIIRIPVHALLIPY